MRTAKEIHDAFCDYEIAKAKHPSRIYSNRNIQRKQSGIRTSGVSRAMLARELASLL